MDDAVAKLQELEPAEVYISSTRSAEQLAAGRYAIVPTYNSRAFGKELDGVIDSVDDLERATEFHSFAPRGDARPEEPGT